MLKLIMDKNGAAFSEEVAEQEQSEQRHLANKAREQLIAANGWPGCRHATYVQGYRDALNDLLRKRPVLQPCVHAVALDRVRYTGLLHCGSCQCNSQAASLYPMPWPCRDTTSAGGATPLGNVHCPFGTHFPTSTSEHHQHLCTSQKAIRANAGSGSVLRI
jgi:hypothetical protein